MEIIFYVECPYTVISYIWVVQTFAVMVKYHIIDTSNIDTDCITMASICVTGPYFWFFSYIREIYVPEKQQ